MRQIKGDLIPPFKRIYKEILGCSEIVIGKSHRNGHSLLSVSVATREAWDSW